MSPTRSPHMAEKVGKEQIKREKGYLYYLGKDGYLWKTPTKLNKSGERRRLARKRSSARMGTCTSWTRRGSFPAPR